MNESDKVIKLLVDCIKLIKLTSARIDDALAKFAEIMPDSRKDVTEEIAVVMGIAAGNLLEEVGLIADNYSKMQDKIIDTMLSHPIALEVIGKEMECSGQNNESSDSPESQPVK